MAKLQSFCTCPVYKFGIQLPRRHQDAIEFDMQNANSKWQEAETMELSQIDRYKTFLDLGKKETPT